MDSVECLNQLTERMSGPLASGSATSCQPWGRVSSVSTVVSSQYEWVEKKLVETSAVSPSSKQVEGRRQRGCCHLTYPLNFTTSSQAFTHDHLLQLHPHLIHRH